MNPVSPFAPRVPLVALALSAALGLTATSAQAGGHKSRRVTLVPVEERVVVREVERPVERVLVRYVEPREAAPSVQAPAALPQAERYGEVPVRERYVVREVERPVEREYVREVPVRVREVRLVPVERYVVREVEVLPAAVLVRPKHHFWKW